MTERAISNFGVCAALGMWLTLLGACTEPAYFAGVETLQVDPQAEPSHPRVGSFAQSEYWLDYREPDPAELAERQPPGEPLTTWRPWVERDDLAISVQWRVSSSADQAGTVWVMLDGANEFFDYNPIADYGLGGGEDAEEPEFPTLLGYTPLALAAGATLRGEFFEDDTAEAMYDLDAMSRFCGGPFAVLYNRHEDDPVGTELVPKSASLAGFVMLRLTVAATVSVTLDYAIRIRDRGGILFDSRTDTRRYEVMPMAFTPGLGVGGGTPSDPATPACGGSPP